MSEREVDRFRFSGWQRVDDDHPVASGTPAYRAVYKTLRVVLGEAVIRFPNLLVRFGHGDVDCGGVHLGDAMRGRRRGEWYLPETRRCSSSSSGRGSSVFR